MKTAISQQ